MGALANLGGMLGGLGGYGTAGKLGFMPYSDTQQQGVGMGGLYGGLGQNGSPLSSLFDYANSQGGMGGQQPGQMYANGTQGFSFTPWSNGSTSTAQFVGQMPQQQQQAQQQVGPSGGWGQGPFDPNKVPNNTWTMGQVAAYNAQVGNGTLNSGVDYYHLPTLDEARASWENAGNVSQQPAPLPQPPQWSQSVPAAGQGNSYGLGSLPRAPIFAMGFNPIAQRDAAYTASMGAE
jgi:hypothetical protein